MEELEAQLEEAKMPQAAREKADAELRKLKIDDIQDQLNDLKSAKAAAAASPPSPSAESLERFR